MSFIKNNLSEGEEVRIYGEIHPIIFLDTVIWLGLSVILITYSSLYAGVGYGWVKWLSVGLVLVALIRLSKAAIYKLSTEIAVTNLRIIAKFGLIERATIEIPLLKIESVIIDQSIIDRIFGAGSVGVRGTGTGMAPVRFIDNPIEFRNELNKAIAERRDETNKDF
jgi:uncharacterized membrane protein YdbT with pleckstrin-like domain